MVDPAPGGGEGQWWNARGSSPRHLQEGWLLGSLAKPARGMGGTLRKIPADKAAAFLRA